MMPCPFCGSHEVDQEGWARSDGVKGPACDQCGASAESIERWNTRPFHGTPAQQALIEVAAEEWRLAVDAEKERIRAHVPVWRKIFPWTIRIERHG